MKKKSLSQKILFNNQIMLVLSVIISISIWVYMSMGSSNDTVVTINDVPIQVSLPEEAVNMGLHSYFADQQSGYASVTVTGNRKLLGSITKDDLVVTANASNVDRADTFNLAVSADKNSSINSTFQITNCTPSKVTVKIDTASNKDFKITPKFKYSAKDDYYASVTFDNDTVSVSGPSENIRAISKVCAVAEDMENLESNKEVHARIVLYDEHDTELSKSYLTLSSETVKCTIKIDPKKTVPVKATFKNKPQSFVLTDENMKIAPKEVSVAGSQKDLDTVFSVSLDEIDFATLENKKYDIDSLKLSIPNGCKVIDNNSVIDVTIDFRKLSRKTINVDKFKVNNLSDDFKSSVSTNNLNVTFIGSSDDLKSLSADKITAVINASESNGNTGSQELPVTFDLGDNKTCWAFGSYLASVIIDKK
ncbi:MAG TPA: hypothetical protein DEO32_02505 [Ruminococcaceae bacterium]|nr:hypothetical protein [Oscillospiraceae bacterium]